MQPLPFTPSDEDRCRLRILTMSLQVEMPVLKKGKGKDGGKCGGDGGGEFEMKSETYSYPTWERCLVQKLVRRAVEGGA